MGDTKIFSRDGRMKISSQRLARCESNSMYDAVEAALGLAKLCKQGGNLFVIGNIARKHQV